MKTLMTFTFAVLVSSTSFAMSCNPDGTAASAPESESASTLNEQEPGDNIDMRSSDKPEEG